MEKEYATQQTIKELIKHRVLESAMMWPMVVYISPVRIGHAKRPGF
jgi:hypothetical protein